MLNPKRGLEHLAIILPLILNSCNVVTRITENDENLRLRKEGYNPYHITACGPQALHELLKEYDIDISQKDISKRILEEGITRNILRSFLGILHNESMQITWPPEISDFLRENLDKNNYNISLKIGSDKELKRYLIDITENDENALLLIRNGRKIFGHHWITSKNDPLNYYGKDTQIVMIYKIEEKFPNPEKNPKRFLSNLNKNYIISSFPYWPR